MTDTSTTTPTTETLWCATCGAWRGGTTNPHTSRRHRPYFAMGWCHDTDTYTD